MQDNHQTETEKEREKNTTSRLFIRKGLKYLALSLPLLFGAPILVTIGFKAFNKGNGFVILLLGCFLMLFTIAMVTQAFRLILKGLFSK